MVSHRRDRDPVTASMVANMLRIFCLGFSLLLCLHSAVAAQIQLSQVLTAVRAHFPQIRAAYQQVLSAKGERLSAKGAFDPTLLASWRDTPHGTYENHYAQTQLQLPTKLRGINFYARYLNGRGNFASYDSDFYTASGGEYEVGVTLPLLKNSATDSSRTTLNNSALNYDKAQADYQQSQLTILRQAADAYWDWLTAARVLRIQQQLIALAVKRQKALTEQYHHGDIAKMVVLDNQRALMQRRANLSDDKLQLKNDALTLSFFYRDKSGKPILPKDQQAPTAFPAVRHLAANTTYLIKKLSAQIDKLPKIRSLTKQIQIAKNQLRLAKNALLPTLNLKLYTERDFGQGPASFRRVSYTGMLNFALPLFRREAKGDVATYQAKLKQLDLNAPITASPSRR